MAEGQQHSVPSDCVHCSAVQLRTCRPLACAGTLPLLQQAVVATLLRQGVLFRSAASPTSLLGSDEGPSQAANGRSLSPLERAAGRLPSAHAAAIANRSTVVYASSVQRAMQVTLRHSTLLATNSVQVGQLMAHAAGRPP